MTPALTELCTTPIGYSILISSLKIACLIHRKSISLSKAYGVAQSSAFYALVLKGHSILLADSSPVFVAAVLLSDLLCAS